MEDEYIHYSIASKEWEKWKEKGHKKKIVYICIVLFRTFYITYDYNTLKLFQLIQTWFMCN
jgi:hypothetical protein